MKVEPVNNLTRAGLFLLFAVISFVGFGQTKKECLNIIQSYLEFKFEQDDSTVHHVYFNRTTRSPYKFLYCGLTDPEDIKLDSSVLKEFKFYCDDSLIRSADISELKANSSNLQLHGVDSIREAPFPAITFCTPYISKGKQYACMYLFSADSKYTFHDKFVILKREKKKWIVILDDTGIIGG